MTRFNRRTLLAALAAAALGLAPVGCGGRPPGIATQPGDVFIELTDLNAEKIGDQELKMKVHYNLPDGLPHPDAWFRFVFEVNDGKSGVSLIHKQGRELNDEGDIETVTNPGFVRRKAITFGIQVWQADKKAGPWRPVSEKLSCDF